MRKTFRVLSYVLFVAAFVRLYFDFEATVLQDRAFRMFDTGEIWASIHRESLLGLQPGVERYLPSGPWIWENLVFPVLQTPLFPIMIGFAILFWIAGRGEPQLR